MVYLFSGVDFEEVNVSRMIPTDKVNEIFFRILPIIASTSQFT